MAALNRKRISGDKFAFKSLSVARDVHPSLGHGFYSQGIEAVDFDTGRSGFEGIAFQMPDALTADDPNKLNALNDPNATGEPPA